MLKIEVDGVISAGTSDYIEDAITEGSRARCAAVLISLDTPGGMLEPTRRIVRQLLESPIPVIVYVAPTGARAGSAGAFITLAGHVAAMSPGSSIGAAHPVIGLSGDPEAAGQHMAAKIESSTAALARSIAEERHRNVAWAERAVRKSASATAQEAQALGIVDLLVRDEAQLLAAVNGFAVRVRGAPRIIRLDAAVVRPFAPTIQQRALKTLGDPNLAYGLLILGVLGLVLEGHSPGVFVPGALGVLCLMLSAIGLDALPVNLGAIGLLVLAAALLILELYVPSFGLLTAAALVCLLVGAGLLVDRSDPRFLADRSVTVSPGVVWPLAVLVALATLGLAWTAARLRKTQSPVGAEGLVGELGEVIDTVDATGGRVRVHGESWHAHCPSPLAPGQRVEVLSVDGLELEVRPADVRRGQHHTNGPNP